jgi:hypothetical protein
VAATAFGIGYSAWNARLFPVLGLGPRRSSIVVDDDELRVRMGWAFTARIPRAGIRSSEPDDDRVWGWGVHGWKGKWLVNGSSQGLARLSIDPPVRARCCGVGITLRVLRVSVDDRDDFLRCIA